LRKFDCLVIGCGAAGLSAGIEYMENSENGDCLVLGSQLTNSSLSPWNMRKPDTETIGRKMKEGGDDLGDKELRETYLENYEECINFLEEVGLTFEDSNLGIIPENEQSALRKIHNYYTEEKNGEIEDRKVKNLLVNREGLVIGVRTDEEDIVADNIILAAGGMSNLFSYSSASNQEALPVYWLSVLTQALNLITWSS